MKIGRTFELVCDKKEEKEQINERRKCGLANSIYFNIDKGYEGKEGGLIQREECGPGNNTDE